MKKYLALILATLSILSLMVPASAHEAVSENHSVTCTCCDVSYLFERYEPSTRVTINLNHPVFPTPATYHLRALAATCYFAPRTVHGTYIETMYGTHTRYDSVVGEFDWNDNEYKDLYANGHEHKGELPYIGYADYVSTNEWACTKEEGCTGGNGMHYRKFSATGTFGGYLTCK